MFLELYEIKYVGLMIGRKGRYRMGVIVETFIFFGAVESDMISSGMIITINHRVMTWFEGLEGLEDD